MPFRSDRVNSPDEPSWIAMLVFNDSDEMEALIEGWGTSPANTAPFAGASTG
ncbi:MAG: hypothetical protein HKN23_04110 [Verrucomicrobiales bacterium]|nr:hypothetical protein [Verrucomicrobiales bacterium]